MSKPTTVVFSSAVPMETELTEDVVKAGTGGLVSSLERLEKLKDPFFGGEAQERYMEYVSPADMQEGSSEGEEEHSDEEEEDEEDIAETESA